MTRDEFLILLSEYSVATVKLATVRSNVEAMDWDKIRRGIREKMLAGLFQGTRTIYGIPLVPVDKLPGDSGPIAFKDGPTYSMHVNADGTVEPLRETTYDDTDSTAKGK